jgi:hypothetical protein
LSTTIISFKTTIHCKFLKNSQNIKINKTYQKNGLLDGNMVRMGEEDGGLRRGYGMLNSKKLQSPHSQKPTGNAHI